MVNKQTHFGGWFNNLEKAVKVRNEMVRRLHGEFANP
jgi:hypothetical protein